MASSLCALLNKKIAALPGDLTIHRMFKEILSERCTSLSNHRIIYILCRKSQGNKASCLISFCGLLVHTYCASFSELVKCSSLFAGIVEVKFSGQFFICWFNGYRWVRLLQWRSTEASQRENQEIESVTRRDNNIATMQAISFAGSSFFSFCLLYDFWEDNSLNILIAIKGVNNTCI